MPRPIPLIAILITVCRPAAADDGAARAAILADQHVSQSAFDLRHRASSMPLEPRYTTLVKWVLPDDPQHPYRVEIGFAPLSDRSLSDTLQAAELATNTVSPAIALVESASELGRLESLRQLVLKRPTGNVQARLSRQALLALISLAEGNFDAARESLERGLQLVTSADHSGRAERGPEAVMMWEAARHPQTIELARELAFVVYEQTRTLRDLPRSERWHRQVYSLKHWLEWQSQRPPKQSSSFARIHQTLNWPLTNWRPVSRMTAETSGRGYPLAGWTIADGEVSHVTSHDHDYLYYRVPLAGDFDVEADLTTFGYRDIQLAAGGIFAGPGYDLKACLHGNFRHDSQPLRIDPPLTRMLEWMRVRIRVRNGLRTTFINGREVFRSLHTGDPWIAIHSPWYTNGAVKNLQITGDVSVPAEIDLLTHADLPGWVTYYDEIAGGDFGDWQLRDQSARQQPARRDAAGTQARNSETADTRELVGLRSGTSTGNSSYRAPEGTFSESLLRYHRPVFEDGIISYEYFYEPGTADVAPALGGTAFLLTQRSVIEHRMTDGRFEQLGRSPIPPGYESALRGRVATDAATTIPLRAGDWNRIELNFQAGVLTIRLNELPVHTADVSDLEVPHFGLFHYADQTQARVRRLRWRGNWPDKLPPLNEQELAGHETATIDAQRKELSASFEYDFAQGLDTALFVTTGGDTDRNVRETPEGIRVTQPGGDGYPNIALVPQLQLGGDFDIVAEFERFDTQLDQSADANLQLYVALQDEAANECRLFRRCKRHNSGTEDQLLQASQFTGPPDKRGYLFFDSPAEESRSGRLRLARRGDVLHYLYAALDSPHYRLVSSRKVSNAETRTSGVRLILETQEAGVSSVTWRKLSIRAESITGAAIGHRYSLAELDEQRSRLSARREFDFTQLRNLDSFITWGDANHLTLTPQGLELKVPGSDRWQASGLSLKNSLVGDFDVAMKLDVLQFEATPPGQDSLIYLQAELADPAKTATDLRYRVNERGNSHVELQFRQDLPDGTTVYQQFGRVRASPEMLTELRMLRRGPILYSLARFGRDSPPKILDRRDVGTDPVPASYFRILIHTGGSGRTTHARFRSLSVHASDIQ